MATLKKETGKKKTLSKKAAKPVAKAAVKKPAVKKATAKPVAKKTSVKKTVVKKPAAAKTVAKKAVVKKAAVKKVAAQKPAGTKPATTKSAVKKTAVSPQTAQTPSGIPEQLRDAALKVLDERQAEEIVTIPLIGRSSVADYMIIASGRAGRQISAIADYLREAFFKLGVRQIRVEGKAEANWVLIDAGDVIIHLFRPEVRTYYDLDRIWDKNRK